MSWYQYGLLVKARKRGATDIWFDKSGNAHVRYSNGHVFTFRRPKRRAPRVFWYGTSVVFANLLIHSSQISGLAWAVIVAGWLVLLEAWPRTVTRPRDPDKKITRVL